MPHRGDVELLFFVSRLRPSVDAFYRFAWDLWVARIRRQGAVWYSKPERQVNWLVNHLFYPVVDAIELEPCECCGMNVRGHHFWTDARGRKLCDSCFRGHCARIISPPPARWVHQIGREW